VKLAEHGECDEVVVRDFIVDDSPYFLAATGYSGFRISGRQVGRWREGRRLGSQGA
jgi:hypothetical protein